ncbi:MAG: hypothetical protein H6815_04645 [Phycisphaeraceae bacterium]|nr:hypothetical protein [Phycisphaerales bacterium]MCB9859722.1 hypothetical protein [Phycisphaeraceae bacterium]
MKTSMLVGGFIACAALSTAASAQALIAVDFENIGVPFSPTNWNVLSGAGALPNLIDETGAATGIELLVSSGSSFETAPNPATLPMHSQSLAGADDYIFGTGQTVLTLNFLNPGSEYEVYVFGLRGFDMGNDITIAGGSAPVIFDQDGAPGDFYINSSIGSSSQDLSSYAVFQTADSAGQINITIVDDLTAGGTGWTCAGIAIREAGTTCYADCDGSGQLNIFDYICFGNEYAAGTSYADCDGSGQLNIFDYICFGNEYAAGCP